MAQSKGKTSNIRWYNRWWGIIFAIIFLPFFIVYYFIWSKSKLETVWKTTITVIVFILIAVVIVFNVPALKQRIPLPKTTAQLLNNYLNDYRNGTNYPCINVQYDISTKTAQLTCNDPLPYSYVTKFSSSIKTPADVVTTEFDNFITFGVFAFNINGVNSIKVIEIDDSGIVAKISMTKPLFNSFNWNDLNLVGKSDYSDIKTKASYFYLSPSIDAFDPFSIKYPAPYSIVR